MLADGGLPSLDDYVTRFVYVYTLIIEEGANQLFDALVGVSIQNVSKKDKRLK